MIDRDGYRPNVGIIICNWKNEVFWGKRVKEHSWQFPQGGIKAGETPERAMFRELHEEVGLDGLPLGAEGAFDLDVHAIPAHGDEPAHLHFDVRFLFRARSLALRVGDEVRAARWFPLASIASVETDESVMRAVRKLGAC